MDEFLYINQTKKRYQERNRLIIGSNILKENKNDS